LLALLLIGLVFNGYALAEEGMELFSAEGYRIARIHSPVPDSVPNGNTVSTNQVKTLLQDPATLLIDVLPAPVKPRDRPSGLLWLPPSGQNIPGSVWLPNVGFGGLSEELERYFRNNLDKLSANDKSRKIIIYCLADCWMSWNAAKRAASYGYSQIYWYPEGSTGWEAAGLPLEKNKPVPMDNP
jgi:PQQ-dependent catabolism-associated CXXCW motif protein